MAPYILILAHLAGDFLFQPGRLVMWKERSVIGVLIHVLIIVSLNIVLFGPYLNQGALWIALGALGVTHFFQDWGKVVYEKKFNKKKLSYPFFLDQFLHLVVIFFVGNYLVQNLVVPEINSEIFNQVYFNEKLFIYAVLLILFSYVLDIVIYQVKRHKNPKLKYRRHYDNMSKRVFAFAVVYALFLVITLWLK